MKPVYKIALGLSYIITDLAEYIAQPAVDALWNVGGRLEYWAHKRLTAVKEKDQ
jgi:hypothetical protein